MCQRILAVIILSLSIATAHAALIGRMPVTPGGTDYQAYYDDVLNITWVADANLSRTSGYDVDGLMLWAQTQAWIASLNAASYLGVSDWWLPIIPEMDYMFGTNLVTAATPGPFINVSGSYIDGGTQVYLPEYYSLYSFIYGTHTYALGLRFPGARAWAVRPGDIDADEDAVAESADNCTLIGNPDQLDTDADGYGNDCDADLNNSGHVTAADLNLLRSVLNRSASFSPLAAAADMNGSGLVTVADFQLLRARMNTGPGPSGLHP